MVKPTGFEAFGVGQIGSPKKDSKSSTLNNPPTQLLNPRLNFGSTGEGADRRLEDGTADGDEIQWG